MNNYFCTMDVMVYAMRPINYTIVQVVPLLLMGLWTFRYEFNYSILLRKSSWRMVWKNQLKKILIQANVSAILFLGIIGIVFCTLPFYNWNQQESYFYMKNEVFLTESVMETAICIYMVCLVRNILIQSTILLSLWMKNSVVPGILVMCCICAIEIAQMQIRIFYWIFSVDYRMWVSVSGRGLLLASAVGYLGLLYAVFNICMSRKEFLNEKNEISDSI